MQASDLRRLISDTLLQFDAGRHYSDTAIDLLIGTAAVESNLGRFVYQKPSGPVFGIYQMELNTANWLLDEWIFSRPKIDRSLVDMCGIIDERYRKIKLAGDLVLQTILARCKYLSIPESLPSNDVEELAKYWKKYYNTPLGKGTEAQFQVCWNFYLRRD